VSSSNASTGFLTQADEERELFARWAHKLKQPAAPMVRTRLIPMDLVDDCGESDAEASTQNTTSSTVESKQVDDARRNLRFKYKVKEDDFRAIDLAIETAMRKVPNGTTTLLNDSDHQVVIDALRKRTDDQDAVRALQLVHQALAWDKKKELSIVEQLIFVQVMGMRNYIGMYGRDRRVTMFLTLTGRSLNWWDKHHYNGLARI
jgi:hypothetical protein